MQVTLRIGHCLEFTTRIEQTAFLSQPASLEEAAPTDARPSRSPHKAEGLSAISASHTYHLCGSISSAALREKSDDQGSIGPQYKSDEVGTCQCREGLHALPKIMFDLFLSK